MGGVLGGAALEAWTDLPWTMDALKRCWLFASPQPEHRSCTGPARSPQGPHRLHLQHASGGNGWT
jgi:hypothetical protein